MPRTSSTAEELQRALRHGQVIPAHPLALTAGRSLDQVSQRALTRYYLAAGAGGVAVAVHTTQFALREHGLLRPVLSLASDTLHEQETRDGQRRIAIAGVCGETRSAVQEATVARELGYDMVLPNLGALRDASDDEVVEHHRALGEVLPVFAFYLQPAVGGRWIPPGLWRRIVEVPEVLAIKVAPFDRYRTLDVVRAVVESGRANDVALYTGNDDAILWDLLSEFRMPGPGGEVRVRFVGGLLGQWAVWTRSTVRWFDRWRATRDESESANQELHGLASQLTEANAALFDSSNGFAGCIPGLHHVLVEQGLMQGPWCLDTEEVLSPGQADEIERVRRAYPHLLDDDFVAEHLHEWRNGS